MMCMALSRSPKLLTADEPATAPDVTIQARTLYLMRKPRGEEKTSKRRRTILEGDVPSPSRLPDGCPFHTTRCRHCMEKCKNSRPDFREAAPGHCVACHLYDN